MDGGRRTLALVALLVLTAGCGDPVPAAPPAGSVAPPPVEPQPVPERPPASRVPPIRVVVRGLEGEPIAGARVVARPTPDEKDEGFWMPGWIPGASPSLGDWRTSSASRDAKPAAEAVTGADGGASLTSVPAGRWTILLDAEGRVARTATCTLAAGDPEPTVEIRAETGAPFAGRVVTSRGAPVAHAAVVATFPAIAIGGRADRREDSALVRTDAHGRFRFEALPETIVWFQCAPPGSWSSHVWPVRVGAVSSIDLVLDVRGPVEGSVFSVGDGKPVAGAGVTFSVEGWHTARSQAYAVTDAEGRYRVPMFPGAGVASIEVDAKGFWRVPRVIGARQPPFRLYEDRPTVLNLTVHADSPERADVRGVVRGPDGPVAGAKVSLVGLGDDYYASPTRRTDAAGRYWFFGVPPRDLVVLASSEGLFQPGAAAMSQRDGGTVPDPNAPMFIASDAERPVERDVTLVRGGRVSGRVVDAAGVAVAGADVFARNDVRAKSGADGTFVLVGLDEARESTVSAASEAAGLSGESAKFVAGAGTDAEGVEVVLRPYPARARVTVTGRIAAPADAPPIRGARAEFGGSWAPADRHGRFRFEFEMRHSGETDTFRAVAPGWGEKDVEFALPAGGGAVDAGEIVVEKGRTIRGTVTCGGTPVAGAVITCERKRENLGFGCRFDEDPSLPVLAVADASGAFAIAEFPPATYTLHATAPGHLATENDVEVTTDDGEVTLFLEMAAHLRGRVLRADGQPVVGARVSASHGDGEDSKTGEDGSFDLVVAEGVECVVEVKPGWDREDDFLECESESFVAPCDPVEIRVHSGQSISGCVTGAAGAPAAGVKVSCFPAGSHESYRSRDTTTGADGTFTVMALADGRYDVEVSQGLAAPVVVKDVEGGRRDVDVRLDPALVIEGVLVDAEGRPARRMTLVACAGGTDDDDDSSRTIEAQTDESGRFRLVGAGGAPCRIELRGTGSARFSSYADTSSLVGGSAVSAGVQGLVLRIPTKDAVTVAGRFVDDAGRPVTGERATVRVSERCSVGARSDEDGRFEVAGVRLDVPCEIEVWGAGIEWTLAVPAGTRDLVVTVGADGLHRVEAGGRAVEKAAARARVDAATEEHRYFPTARYVHAVTGATVERDSLGDGFDVPDLPVGPYRVEVRERRDGDWLPTREKKGEAHPRLVVAD